MAQGMMPPQGGEAPASEGSDPAAQLGEIAAQTAQGLQLLAKATTSLQGIPDEIKAELGDITQRFMSVVKALASGQMAGPAQDAMPGTEQTGAAQAQPGGPAQRM